MREQRNENDMPGRRARGAPARSRDRPGAARLLLPVAIGCVLLVIAIQTACAASHQPTRPSERGVPSSVAALEAVIDARGPIEFERVVAANWIVARSGLLNLDHPKARAAKLEDRPEPIEVFLYVLRHPTEGTFFVDSGVASGFRAEGGHPSVSALVGAAMKLDRLEVLQSTAEWIEANGAGPDGVFLTHIHLDHVMGLPDVPRSTPVYVGPGETRASGVLNLATRGTIDRFLEREDPLREWAFPALGREGELAVVDVFGDGALFALHAAGHTPGSTAFVVRTPSGSKLLLGDVSHTAWGWLNGVEPGSFTEDHAGNAASLAFLRDLAAAHPSLEVHLGHQRLPGEAGMSSRAAGFGDARSE